MKNVIELRILIDCENKTYSILNESRYTDSSSRYVLSEGYLSRDLFSNNPDNSYNCDYSDSFDDFDYEDYEDYEDKSLSPLGIAGILSATLSQGDGLEDLNELEEIEEVDELESVDRDEDNIRIY
jgi:hypothetical protein